MLVLKTAQPLVVLCGGQLEVMSQFSYLGSSVSSECTMNTEIRHRELATSSAFQHWLHQMP